MRESRETFSIAMTGFDIRLNSEQGVKPSAGGALSSGPVEGRYRGERVRVTLNPTSRIEDAAEELTFSIAEEREKSLARREIQKDEGASRQVERIRKIEEMQALREMQRNLPDLDAGKLARLRERLRHLPQRDSEHALKEAERFFDDPSLQYGALTLLSQPEAIDDPGLRRVIGEAAHSLIDTRGPEVRSGLNVSAVAAKHASPELGDLRKLRSDYRDLVLQPNSLEKSYELLQEKFGQAGLTEGIRFLLAALAADLNADGTSIDKAKLQAVLDDIVRLETLVSLLDSGKQLLARVEKRGLNPGYDSPTLLRELVSLRQQQWLQPDQVAAIALRAGMTRPEDRIYFLREFTGLARQIPLRFYDTAEQREKLIGVLQQALDKATEGE